LGEVSASKLVSTPGASTFAHETFRQLHYTVGNDLAARCLLLLAAVVLLAAACGLAGVPLSRKRQATRPGPADRLVRAGVHSAPE
jgi:hypothetical protein